LDDPDKTGGMTERKVGFYECSTCSTRFPHIYGRQKLKIVKTEKWIDLKNSLSEAEDSKARFKGRIEELERDREVLCADLESLKENLIITKLEARAETLQCEVSLLADGKKELEKEVQQYTPIPETTQI
jgi:chromosome segregation ATPase